MRSGGKLRMRDDLLLSTQAAMSLKPSGAAMT
jgi:hypothetical protein